MKINKKMFTYKNKIIFSNGAILKLNSIKYIHNFQLTFKLLPSLKEDEIITKKLMNKLSFVQKIFH